MRFEKILGQKLNFRRFLSSAVPLRFADTHHVVLPTHATAEESHNVCPIHTNVFMCEYYNADENGLQGGDF